MLRPLLLAGLLCSLGSSTVRAGDAIVQLFEWNYVSPPQEHVTGPAWWTSYQPVSYQISSKHGDRAAFAGMVSACQSVGVGIIVDTVLNLTGHGDNTGTGTGFAGSSFTKYNYPAVPYSYNNFHHCGRNGNDGIVNWNDAYQVYNCELSGLSDLATDTPAVQQIEANYLNDLLSLGVAGYRLDAAKQMLPNDIASILALTTNRSAFVVQEVQYGGGEPVTPGMYTQNGFVHEFRAAWTLLGAFTGGSGISGLLIQFPGQGWVDSAHAVTFVTDHDTERSRNSLRWDSPNNAYLLGTVFLLAQSYGIPTVYSGFDFTSYDAGQPMDGRGALLDVGCYQNGWRCEQRNGAFVGMIGFHNAVKGADQRGIVAEGNQRLAFGRGAIGQVFLNNQGDVWTRNFAVSLPDGSYCDVVHSTKVNVCSNPIVVSGGFVAVSVPPFDAVALYATGSNPAPSSTSAIRLPSTTATSSPISTSSVIPSPPTFTTAPPPSSTTVLVSFTESATVSSSQHIVLVGSVPALGNWSPSLGVPLVRSGSSNSWSVNVSLPAGTTVQFKFIKLSTGGAVVWESDPNRSLNVVRSTSAQVVNDVWR